MGLEKMTKIVQAKNAFTQYVTIPASVVQDSQYPFKDGGVVKLTIDPVQELMVVSKEDIRVFGPEASFVEVEPGSFLVKIQKEVPHEDLKVAFFVRHKKNESS